MFFHLLVSAQFHFKFAEEKVKVKWSFV